MQTRLFNLCMATNLREGKLIWEDGEIIYIYIYIYMISPSSQMIGLSWFSTTVWVNCFSSIVPSQMTSVQLPFANLEAEMKDRVLIVDFTWCGTRSKFLCPAILVSCWIKFWKYTANDACGITSSQRNCVLFTPLIRLHVIDLSSFREKNTVTNITPPRRFLNLRVQHYSFPRLSLQQFMIFTSLLKGGFSMLTFPSSEYQFSTIKNILDAVLVAFPWLVLRKPVI